MENQNTTENQSQSASEHSFEESVQELEAIVQRMSSGDQSLEASIAEFERGVKIVRDCQKMLKEAEQRVAILTQSADGQFHSEQFSSE